MNSSERDSTTESYGGETFGSKLKHLGQAASQETKRNASLVALKTKIKKARHFDLRKTHQDLGRKCYGSNCLAYPFKDQFKEISKLQKRIDEKRRGLELADGATTMKQIQVAALNTAGKVRAKLMAFRLSHLFMGLGEKVGGHDQILPELASEMEALNTVKAHITALETKYATLCEDRATRSDLKRISVSVAEHANATFRSVIIKVLNQNKTKELATHPMNTYTEQPRGSKKSALHPQSSNGVVICAFGILAAFFMPWIQIFGAGMSGYNLGQLGSYGNYAWAIPILAGGTILLSFNGVNNRAIGAVTGILPLGALAYALIRLSSEGGANASENVINIAQQLFSIGIYLTIIFCVAILIAAGSATSANSTKPTNC